MSKYRPVPTALWTSRAVRSLKPMPPCPMGLLLYLMTGPETSMVPGVVVVGPAALAEALGWSPKETREQLSALERAGLVRVDLQARLMWVPGQLSDTKPQNPNIATGWAKALAEAPECDLRDDIARALFRVVESDERFAKPFLERFGERLKEPFRNREQEQEQEQEQEMEQEGDAARAAPSPTPVLFPEEGKPKRGGRAPRTLISEDWQPRPEDTKPLADAKLDVSLVVADFVDYWRSKGDLRASWDSTFRMNVRSVLAKDTLRAKFAVAVPVPPPSNGAARPPVPPPPEMLDRLRRFARGDSQGLEPMPEQRERSAPEQPAEDSPEQLAERDAEHRRQAAEQRAKLERLRAEEGET